MTKSRDLDMIMSQDVLGHKVFYEKNGSIREKIMGGQSRPLRSYSQDIAAAWEIVEKLGITLLPVDQGWFAIVGKKHGWASPAEFLIFLQNADFARAGAAVGEHAPLTICLAAMKAVENRKTDPALDVSPEAQNFENDLQQSGFQN
jgi:hypothetical protein